MAMAVSSQQSRDAALLRATTELFVLDQTHDHAEIRRFEELTAHFLTKVTPADRAFVAERLARHPDAPGSVLRLLGKDLVEIASPILRHSAHLNSFDLLAILAATGPAHWRLIAGRDDLAPDIVAALRRTGDPETQALLPEAAEDEARADVPLPPLEPAPALPVVETLAEAASPVPPVSTTELPAPPERETAATTQPAEPPPTEALSVFAAARVLTASLSAEMTALATEMPVPHGLSRRTFESLAKAQPKPTPAPIPPVAAAKPLVAETLAKPAEARRPARSPKLEADAALAGPTASQPPKPFSTEAFLALDPAERRALLGSLSTAPVTPPKLTPAEIDNAFRAALSRARLTMLARQRQRQALISTLAEGLRLDVARVTALLDDPSGEPLVVLLKAIGLSEREAQQVLLLANPVVSAAVDTFSRLSELLASLEQPAADKLVGHWRTDGMAGHRPAHQPHFVDIAPRSQARQSTAEPNTGREQPSVAEMAR